VINKLEDGLNPVTENPLTTWLAVLCG
jgi:hypothetical protein